MDEEESTLVGQNFEKSSILCYSCWQDEKKFLISYNVSWCGIFDAFACAYRSKTLSLTCCSRFSCVLCFLKDVILEGFDC